MADDKSKHGPADRARVNVHEPYELQYWTEKWGVSGDDLRAAVEAVGVMATDVAKHLGKKPD
jgi:hypothetical protein